MLFTDFLFLFFLCIVLFITVFFQPVFSLIIIYAHETIKIEDTVWQDIIFLYDLNPEVLSLTNMAGAAPLGDV